MNFENAIRNKYRFGQLNLEDLYDLPLTSAKIGKANLNDIAKELSRQLKAESEEDFVNPKSNTNKELQEKLEIVKYVISVRQAENEALRTAAEKQAKKAKLLEVLDRKQNQELENLSPEAIKTMLAEL